jgi:hypothetical protein
MIFTAKTKCAQAHLEGGQRRSQRQGVNITVTIISRVSRLRFAFSRLRFAWVSPGVVCWTQFGGPVLPKNGSKNGKQKQSKQRCMQIKIEMKRNEGEDPGRE